MLTGTSSGTTEEVFGITQMHKDETRNGTAHAPVNMVNLGTETAQLNFQDMILIVEEFLDSQRNSHQKDNLQIPPLEDQKC